MNMYTLTLNLLEALGYICIIFDIEAATNRVSQVMHRI
jgi:hypothetical protein